MPMTPEPKGLEQIRSAIEAIREDVISMVPSRLVEANRRTEKLSAMLAELPAEDSGILLSVLQDLKRCLMSASRTFTEVLELAAVRGCLYSPDGAPALEMRTELRVDG